MRILFLSHYFPPEGNAPASRTFEHTKRWVTAGANVTVLTSAPNVPHGRLYPGYQNRLRQEEFLDGVRVIRVWTYLAANAGNIRRTLNYLTFMCSAVLVGLTLQKPDVIIATSPQFFCGWAGVILSRLRRVKFVLEVRDIWPDSIAAVGALKHNLSLQVLSALEAQMYRAADQIVTVGEGYRQALLQRRVPDGKVIVIPNGADLDRFKSEQREPPSARGKITHRPFRCVYVGTIGMASRLDLVLEAARELQSTADQGFHFVLIGDGADRERLQAKADHWALTNVTFTGLVKKAEIPHYLQSADACLVHLRGDPLFETVLPSKLFEAMAMAKPIILGVPGSAAQILNEADAGILIEPENPQSLLVAMKRLKDRPELAKRLGQAGRKYVAKRYNRDFFAQLYLSKVLDRYQFRADIPKQVKRVEDPSRTLSGKSPSDKTTTP